MTPRAAGRAAPAIRLAVLALLLAAIAGLTLGAPGAGEVAAQGKDYDRDGDGLIEVRNLAQLNAIRWDLDGNGVIDNAVSAEDAANYNLAFPGRNDAAPNINGCNGGAQNDACLGYELKANLDFDENGDGALGPLGDPTYWNDGQGWMPIGFRGGSSPDARWHGGIFEGNGHTISNLYIKRHIVGNTVCDRGIGLFGLSYGRLRNVGMVNPYISVTLSGTYYRSGGGCNQVITHIGSLTGFLGGSSSVTAEMAGSWVNGGGVTFTHGGGTNSIVNIGCLVGGTFTQPGNTSTEISANYANCPVNASMPPVNGEVRGGGLVGSAYKANITASYARGNVTCRTRGPMSCAGLLGASDAFANIFSSYATGNVVNDANCHSTIQGRTRTGGLASSLPNGGMTDSYSTGRVEATFCPSRAGALTSDAPVTSSYWNTDTAGINTGSGAGHTTARLQAPTGYTDIYANWNRNLDGQPGNDDPWRFGTSSQYPILKYCPDAPNKGCHDALSQRRQRRPQPTATEYTPSYDERIEEEPTEYVAPPIVYNLNIRFSVKGITLDEGESATYRVRMSQSPVGHPAKVRIHSNNPDVVVAPTVLTFSSANYSQWQTVKVTTLRDPNDTDESANLAHRGPNLGYGAIIVTVNDTWPGAATETVNGHTVTLRHTLDAPYGVTVTAPETLNADTDITIAGPPPGMPAGAPGYGLGQTAAARMLADIRVQGTPEDGLDICLPLSAALLAEADDRPLTLLRYANGGWTPVAGSERRDDADGATLLCAAGVTEYGVFATAYTLPALGAVSDLAATAGDALGMVMLTWTPGANAERHWVAGVKQSDRSKLAVWAAADAMGSHTASGLDAGETYIFTVTAGRGEGDSRQWSAWAPWATITLPAPAPTPTPTPEPTFNAPRYPILR